MAIPRSPILLIDRGDLPSLTALVVQSDAARLVLWHLVDRDEAAPRRRAAVEDHHELFGTRALLLADAWDSGGLARRSDDPMLFAAMDLAQASIAARRHGCDRVIWPVHVGLDVDRVRQTIEVVTGIAELTELAPPVRPDAPLGRGSSDPGLLIEVPFLDLDDGQIIDLADDGGAPAEAFWPCDHGGAAPCGSCPSCLRWLPAYRDLGRLDGWEQGPGPAGENPQETRATAPSA